MLLPKFTSQFRRDYERIARRAIVDDRLKCVIEALCKGEVLEASYRDHALVSSRNYKNVRELHIRPDLLLIYKMDYDRNVLKLIRLGTHSDLF